jgi:phage shock protein E
LALFKEINMKKIIIATTVVAIAAGGIAALLFTSGCKGHGCDITPPVAIKLSLPDQVSRDISNGGILIDVRTTTEFIESHAKEAVNLPLADIQKGILPSIAKDLPVYLYCRTGIRAGKAKIILENAGFTTVTNIGGLTDWQTQGGEVITN